MYVCGTEERASTSTPVLRVSMHRSARGTLSSLAPMQPTGEDMRCFVATASTPVFHHPVLSLTSVAGHEVRADATRKVMEMGEGNDMEETAMDGDAGVSENRFPNLSQSRPGTRHTLGGRTVGTGRNTRANLLQGYLLAFAMAITKIGVRKWLEEFGVADEDHGCGAAVRSFIDTSLATHYRGQVWPLEMVFGAVAGISYADHLEFKEEELMTCWNAPRGDVQCTCTGSTVIEAIIDVSSDTALDHDCYHARLFSDALAIVGALLGDSGGVITRWFVARMGGSDGIVSPFARTERAEGMTASTGSHNAGSAARRGRRGRASTRLINGTAVSKTAGDVEEAQVEVLTTGGFPVAVVVAGEKRRWVPAPVKCARKTTSCCYCATSLKKSCVHVLHTRHLLEIEAMVATFAVGAAIPPITK